MKQSRLLKEITPSPILFLETEMSMSEAADLMASARTDAGLVKATDGQLVGILTDSDVSIKVAASGLSLRKTKVKDVMTINPLCVRDTERADVALALMAEKRARHLPVLDAQSRLTGMLDVTRLLFDAIQSLEYTKDQQSQQILFPAMNRAFGLVQTQSVQVPTLAETLNNQQKQPATAAPSDMISLAFQGLRNTKRSVLVLDEKNQRLVGILSKSDLAKRALRTALSFDQNSHDSDDVAPLARLHVRDVMTQRPTTISSDRTLLDALHEMHDRRFSSLPVIDAISGLPIGVVDVIDLLAEFIALKNKSQMPSPSSNNTSSARTNTEKSSTTSILSSRHSSSSSIFNESIHTTPSLSSAQSQIDQEGIPPAAAQPVVSARNIAKEPPIIATSIEELPSRVSVQCAISPSDLKHAKPARVDAAALLAIQVRDCTSCSKSRRNYAPILLTSPGDVTFKQLKLAILEQLPDDTIHFNLEYSDELATLKVLDDATLRAATQLSMGKKLSDEPTVKIDLVSLRRPRSLGFLQASCLIAIALASIAVFINKPARRSLA